MTSISEWVEASRQEGYSAYYAAAKVCQDIPSGMMQSIRDKNMIYLTCNIN